MYYINIIFGDIRVPRQLIKDYAGNVFEEMSIDVMAGFPVQDLHDQVILEILTVTHPSSDPTDFSMYRHEYNLDSDTNKLYSDLVEFTQHHDEVVFIYKGGSYSGFEDLIFTLKNFDASDEEDELPPINMDIVHGNVKKRMLELDEEEESRKKARRLSDPRIQKCTHMNTVCTYQPLDMEDWCEHDERYYYGPDVNKRCFDAIELLRHLESNLTSEKYGNPYPQYPHDPFSRTPFTIQEMKDLIAFARNADIVVEDICPTLLRFIDWAPGSIDGKPFTTDVMYKVVENVIKQAGGSGNGLFKSIFSVFR